MESFVRHCDPNDIDSCHHHSIDVGTIVNDTNVPNNEMKHNVISNGICLKHYEKVVAKLLSHNIKPTYSQLPKLPPSFDGNTITEQPTIEHPLIWPYTVLPKAARVYGNLPGQLHNIIRAVRKEYQIHSVLRCILPLLLPPPSASQTLNESRNTVSNFTIVDFGGGSGHLSIPLALLLPRCTVICVDLSQHSLQLLHSKAMHCSSESATNKDVHPDRRLQSTNIPNLFTYHGSVHTFVDYKYHLAVALHLCGEATDVVLRLTNSNNTRPSIVVAPCCVGKLSNNSHNPYVFQATGYNHPTIQYPQSKQYCSIITDVSDWNALAQAADYGTDISMESISNIKHDVKNSSAIRKTAKALLELDRCYYLTETYGYHTALFRMDSSQLRYATPKNDIIVAWLPIPLNDNKSMHNATTLETYKALEQDQASQVDIDITGKYLLGTSFDSHSNNNKQHRGNNLLDWTNEEEEQIRRQIITFLQSRQNTDMINSNSNSHQFKSSQNTLIFPTGMGSRLRKLIHVVAEDMKLRHWGVGKKNSDKTVAVSFVVSTS